jgi:site-specific DNA recombinase
MDTHTGAQTIIYLRQSMDREGDRLAVTRQLEDCQTLCARRGLPVLGVIDDNDTSASSARKRPGYERLLGMIKRDEVRVIVAWAVDRLVRKLTDLEQLIDLIEAHRVTVLTLSGELDLSTPAGRLNARILASVARAEVETKAARQKRSSLQRATDGRPHAGPRTIGYDHGLKGVRADEAALIREGFSQLLAGASLRSIMRRWNNAGLRTTRGKEWTTRGVRLALTNHRYAGISAYRARSAKAEVMGAGQWQPLVTAEVFEAAQVILSDPERKNAGNSGRERKHLLPQLAVCGRCQGPMRSGIHHGQPILVCTNLNHLARKSAEIEAYVRGEIAKRLRLPGAGIVVESGTPGVDVQALKDEAAALRVKLDELVDMHLDGEINRAQLERGTRRASERLEAIAAAQAAATGDTILAPLLAAVDPGKAFLDLDDLSKERAVIEALCTVTLYPPRMGRAPFDPNTVQIDWR